MPKITLNLTKTSNQTFYGSDQTVLDLDLYVAGCVAQEVGNANIEVCKAQAIAARTNAYQYVLKDKIASDNSSVFQAFTGSRSVDKAYANAQLGAQLTAGMVLAYNGKPLTPASFSANNGGRITSSKERWGGERAWLVAKDDPYDVGPKTGHGVGMSQRGAKEMASRGFTYKDILAFYYPNTTIMQVYNNEEVENTMSVNSEKVVAFAKSKVGCGYVWGSSGQVLTQSVLNSLVASHGDHIDPSIVSKWMGKQVFDCASLVAQSMKQVGISMASGATSAWNKTAWAEKGTIDTLPKDKVCVLYRATSPTNMQHTGLYLGDETFIDARGSKQGVLHSKISTYAWTHWGIPKGLYPTTSEPVQTESEVLKVIYQAKVTTSGGTLNFRKTASTSGTKIAAIPNGTIVDVIAEEKDWRKITYNGQTGYVMSTYLKKIDGSETTTAKSWYVRVKCDNESDAKALVSALQKIAKAETIEA